MTWGVIYSERRNPHCRCVTVLADVGRQNMGLVLAGGIRAVVTTDTVAEDIHMVEVCGQPTDGRVTVIARITAGNMCLVLAGGIDAIVAADAIANDSAVIKHGR